MDVDMTEDQHSGAVKYNGNTPQLRKLAVVTTLLTLVTLGVYRFWARTRVRRYFWSAVTVDGHGFEYTGKGIEKFIGFLIAVAVLAVYLGVFQVLLSFAGMSLFDLGDSEADQLRAIILTYATFIALAPLIFYAQYRARRYMLSRTKWKGIRFGADQAAWGYALRAIGHWIITIVTLGILLPRQTFYLEKYKADRTWFGTAAFVQEGRWQSLYPAMKHIAIGVILVLTGIALFAFSGVFESTAADITDLEDTISTRADAQENSYARLAFAYSITIIGSIWVYIGFAYYNVHSYRILARQKKLGDDIRFTSEPRTKRIIGIYLLGGLIVSMLAPTIAGLIGGILGFIAQMLLGGFNFGLGAEMPPGVIIGGLFGYVSLFVVGSVLNLIFITQPITQHYAEVTRVCNVDGLSKIAQREGDEMIEAEGFADALDVGAGF